MNPTMPKIITDGLMALCSSTERAASSLSSLPFIASKDLLNTVVPRTSNVNSGIHRTISIGALVLTRGVQCCMSSRVS